jgi:deoxyribodipyrimidine photo-lyase
MQKTLFWFRRDLRAYDNAGLSAALSEGGAVHCVFVFDREILDALPSRSDRRVEFIWHCVKSLALELQELGGSLHILYGKAREEIPLLAQRLGVSAVYCNRDYEPEALNRDAEVAKILTLKGVRFGDFKDQVIFEKTELLTQAGKPFTVFTPYKNAWLKQLHAARMEAWPVDSLAQYFAGDDVATIPELASMGFESTNLLQKGFVTGTSGAQEVLSDFLVRIDHYRALRDFPGKKGVSYLSIHQRFGTISIRELARNAIANGSEGALSWLSELIWRDFYFQIIFNFPHAASGAFKREYDGLQFDQDADLLHAWQQGKTGYPLVDAAMRQLLETGFMHNRLRMVAASFLVKDLMIDWREGETWFAEQLNDFDLAANNGGWQWAASTGCDAQPYFRIFNPVSQSEKFDPDGTFIRRYVPELKRVPNAFIHAPWRMSAAEQSTYGVGLPRDYPLPIVDHATARERALTRYKAVRAHS